MYLQCGVAPNVSPTEATLVIDMRLSVTADLNIMQNMVNKE